MMKERATSHQITVTCKESEATSRLEWRHQMPGAGPSRCALLACTCACNGPTAVTLWLSKEPALWQLCADQL